jgi:hypothetical protein
MAHAFIVGCLPSSGVHCLGAGPEGRGASARRAAATGPRRPARPRRAAFPAPLPRPPPRAPCNSALPHLLHPPGPRGRRGAPRRPPVPAAPICPFPRHHPTPGRSPVGAARPAAGGGAIATAPRCPPRTGAAAPPASGSPDPPRRRASPPPRRPLTPAPRPGAETHPSAPRIPPSLRPVARPPDARAARPMPPGAHGGARRLGRAPGLFTRAGANREVHGAPRTAPAAAPLVP